MNLKGKELEKKINAANLQLRKNQKALIQKIPVPIELTNKGLIAKQSTVDFIGLTNLGLYIAFDVKETKNKKSFPLANIKEHQLLFLNFVQKLGGIAFFLIQFKTIYPNKAFLTPLDLINRYWYNEKRKSIPLFEFNADWLVLLDHTYLNKYLK